MQKLYYARHGETQDLVEGIRSRPDTALTENGRKQMADAGKQLVACGIRPSLIVSSTLPRAIESSKIVARELGYDEYSIPHIPLLNERECGVATGLRHAEIDERWPGGYDTVPGAETLEQLQLRAVRVATWLKQLDEEKVLVVAHGTFGRAMIRAFADRPYTDEYAPDRLQFGRGQIMRLHPLPVAPLAA